MPHVQGDTSRWLGWLSATCIKHDSRFNQREHEGLFLFYAATKCIYRCGMCFGDSRRRRTCTMALLDVCEGGGE